VSSASSEVLPMAGRASTFSAVPSLVSVHEGYERWAASYDHSPNPLLAREERHLLPLLSNLGPRRLLDLACGTGRWTEKLSTRRTRGFGIDFSMAMLQVARGKQSVAGRVARGSCEFIPFAAATFDLAICSFALVHLRDLDSVGRELARVTVEGADLFVSDLHPDSYERGWRVGFRHNNHSAQIEMIPRASERIIRCFESCGFECISQTPLWLGEPEMPIFAQAGKLESFIEVCRIPAILVLHFKRVGARQ
jgi:ubiquinone/menaquinone biosynthesis C-methylase UbiE